MIYIGSDHGGYNLKEELKKFLKSEGVKFQDLGPEKFVDGDDYPDYAVKVAKAVARNLKHDKGILICRSGQGVCIAANKIKGIKAGLAWNEQVAKVSRNDDDTNILCLASDFISTEMAEDIVAAWLNTGFSFEERHLRRLKKIAKI